MVIASLIFFFGVATTIVIKQTIQKTINDD